MEAKKYQISLGTIVDKEVAPLLHSILGAMADNKKIGCTIRIRIVGENKDTIRIDINQEIERYNESLINTDNLQICDFLLTRINHILEKGALNTICAGVEDFIRLKISILPEQFSITTMYARTDYISLKSGLKENKRHRYSKNYDEQKQLLVQKSMALVKQSLVEGLIKLKKKQKQDFIVGYYPEFFIYRDRLGANERYIGDSVDNPPKSIDGLLYHNGFNDFEKLMADIRFFLDKETRIARSGTTDYEFNINLSQNFLNFNSIYHTMIMFKESSRHSQVVIRLE